jgi:hypothetical protein
MKFHFINAVWGDSYTDAFLKVCLPSQLSPGNLPAWPAREQSVYRIFTTAHDAGVIEQSAAYATLARTLPTEIVTIDQHIVRNKYLAMNGCHGQAIREADKAGAGIIFLAPDVVCADGMFRALGKLAATGKRLVAIGMFRIVKETFFPAFLREHADAAGCTATISPRRLVEMGLKHMHPDSRCFFSNSGAVPEWCSNLYWEVPGEGVLGRFFHLHPLLINPSKKGIELGQKTLDSDYVWEACPDAADVYVVQDSDELCMCEFSSAAQRYFPCGAELRAARVAVWAALHANEQHQRFVRHRIALHTCDRSPRWQAAEQESDLFIDTALRLMDELPEELLTLLVESRDREQEKEAMIHQLHTAATERLRVIEEQQIAIRSLEVAAGERLRNIEKLSHEVERLEAAARGGLRGRLRRFLRGLVRKSA